MKYKLKHCRVYNFATTKVTLFGRVLV